MNSKDLLRILVVDDEVEIADIICLFIGGQFSASFVSVSNGLEAIDLLSKNPTQFQLVISDFNMPECNGLELFKFIKSKFPYLPFLLVTSDLWIDHPEFHNQLNVGYVCKPFIDDTLIQETERLLKACSLPSHHEHKYVGISIQTLASIRLITYPMFVRINEDKYVRYFNEGVELTRDEVIKLQKKGILELYVERSHFDHFIESFRHKVQKDMLFRGFQDKSTSALELSTLVQEIVMGAAKTFGLTPEMQELAQKNIQLVKKFTENFDELDSILNWATLSQQEYSFIHCILLCYLTTEVSSHIDMTEKYASKILALVSFFHDITLDNQQIKNERHYIKALSLNSTINKNDLKAVKIHPEASADLIKKWKLCSPELELVIRQHHEKPDGSGFPLQLHGAEINELAACFIVCEDLVQSFLELKDRIAIEKYFSGQAKLYSEQPFKHFYNYFSQKLIQNNKRTPIAS